MPEPQLDGSIIDFLRLLKAAYENGELRFGSQPPPRRPHSAPHLQLEFGKSTATVAGVTAAGSTNISSGTLTIWTMGSTGGPSATTETLTFYNMSIIQCTTEQWTRVRRHNRSANWLFDNPYDHQRKPLIRIKYTTAVTTGTSSYSAAVMEQYGPGIAHTATTITVYNLAASTGFVLSGSTGRMGLAMWDGSTNYRHIQGECT